MSDIWKLLRDAGLSQKAVTAIEAAIQRHTEKAVSETVVTLRRDLHSRIKSEILVDVNKSMRDLIDVHETHCLSKFCEIPKEEHNKNRKLCTACKIRPAWKNKKLCGECFNRRYYGNAWKNYRTKIVGLLANGPCDTKTMRVHINRSGAVINHALSAGIAAGEITKIKMGWYALVNRQCKHCGTPIDNGNVLCISCQQKQDRISELKAELASLEEAGWHRTNDIRMAHKEGSA